MGFPGDCQSRALGLLHRVPGVPHGLGFQPPLNELDDADAAVANGPSAGRLAKGNWVGQGRVKIVLGGGGGGG